MEAATLILLNELHGHLPTKKGLLPGDTMASASFLVESHIVYLVKSSE